MLNWAIRLRLDSNIRDVASISPFTTRSKRLSQSCASIIGSAMASSAAIPPDRIAELCLRGAGANDPARVASLAASGGGEWFSDESNFFLLYHSKSPSSGKDSYSVFTAAIGSTEAAEAAGRAILKRQHQELSFAALPGPLLPPLRRQLQAAGYACTYESPCWRFELTQLPEALMAEHAGRLATALCSERRLQLGRLQQEDAVAVDSVWPYRSTDGSGGSLAFIRSLIATGDTACARDGGTGQPLAWMVR